MASFILGFGTHPFPAGTNVEAYKDVGQKPHKEPSVVAATTSAVVQASGTLTFVGLTAATRYWAVANIGGWRWIAFVTEGTGGDEFITGDDLAAHVAATQAIHGISDTALLEGLVDAGSGVDKLPYYDGFGVAALANLSPYARNLLDDADAAAMRATIGTDAADASRPPSGAAGGVLGGTYPNPSFAVDMATQTELDAVAAAKQPLDADLTAIAALVSAANKLPYATGAGAWALTDLSGFARTFLDDADAATVRATIGAQDAATAATDAELTAAIGGTQPLDADLTAIAALATTAFGRSFLPLVDAAAARALVGAPATVHTHAEADVTNLVTDLAAKQPLDTDLTAFAALVSAANKLPYATGAGTWALTDLSAYGRTLIDDADAATARATLGASAKPAAADATRYVSPLGNDANDGLSPGAAKLTWAAAITDLPAAGGIIYVLAGNYDVTATVLVPTGKPVDIFCAPGVTLRASSSIAGPVLRYQKITQSPNVGIHGGPVIDMNNEAGTGATIGLELQDCWMLDNDVRVINPGSGLGIRFLTVDILFGAYYNRVRGQVRGIKATGTATVTNGSANLTLVTPTTLWKNGMVVTGNGIPAGTTIVSGAGTATMVMSVPAGVGGGAGTAIEGRRGTGAQAEGAASNNAANDNIPALHVTGMATGIKIGPFVDGTKLEDCDCTDNTIGYDLAAGHTVGSGLHEESNATEGIVVRAGATAEIDAIYTEKRKAETTGLLVVNYQGLELAHANTALYQRVVNVPGVGVYRFSANPAAGRWSFIEDGFNPPLEIDNNGIRIQRGLGVRIDILGGGVSIKEGANAMMGRATLVAGTVVVNTTKVTATSEIFLMCQTPGGTPGFLRVSARTAGTSFTILSSSGTDTSVVAWMIVEPL